MSPRIRRFALLAGGSFATMIALSVAGGIAESQHWLDDPVLAKRAESIVLVVSFGLFLLLGFSFVPLMVRLFVVGQTRIGNGEVGPIRWLRAHEVGFVRGVWAMYGLGLVIAAPAMLQDLGFEIGPGESEGVLVARIGMPLDEVRQRSSLVLAEGIVESLTGRRTLIGSPVFDFAIADSTVRFEGCRYYFMTTGEDGDPRVEAISIGASPHTLTRAELIAAHQRVQQALVADGWRSGRYEYVTAEEQALHGGATSSGEGFFWLKGETVLEIQGKRMDDEQPGEDAATAGAWIQVLELRPPAAFADVTFAPPAP